MLFRDRIRVWRGETLLALLSVVKLACHLLGLRRLYKRLTIRLIKPLGLFDRGFYLEHNPDIAASGQPPLRHYVYHGDREGRLPMPLFDPNHYRSQLPKLPKRTNSLLHYAYVGRYLGLSPSPWFNLRFYLANNKDVARSKHDPLVHFLKWGGQEGRSPCPQFDSQFYLRTYPDVVATQLNPLLHYLFFGRQENRLILPEHGSHLAFGDNGIESEANLPEAPPVGLPEESAWEGLRPLANIAAAPITVIVPVYKGRGETLRCLQSVLMANCETPFELVVINDASPDAELAADLERLACQGLFTLLVNSHNQGFVYTVNRGMGLHRNRNVVLLNADTEVYDGWLDRLHQAAYRNPQTGTVTPLSNNATICSYPRFLEDNPYPLELGFAELDAMAAAVNTGVEIEAPTGVGFCMYIKRTCLDKVGLFDEKTFGKGYGEENDFCQRAIRKGWRNIVAADVYVRHLGATSFQGEKAKRVQEALRLLNKRYPAYAKEVDAFIKKDPLKEARLRLDAARLKRMRKEQNLLIVCHNRGGGSERRVQEAILDYSQQGIGVFLLRPVPKQPELASLGHPAIRSLPNINPFELADTQVLAATLNGLRVHAIHTHSLVDFSAEAPERIRQLAEAMGVPWQANLHDYKVICPRINLVDEQGVYCGEPDEAGCNRCLSQRGSDFSATDIRAWRGLHARSLAGAQRILVPDQDMARRLAGYFPELGFAVQPHEALDTAGYRPLMPKLAADQNLRIAIIGAIGKLKGFSVTIACAKLARQHGLPLEFVLMGYSMNDKLMAETGVTVTGKYQEHEALDKLRALAPHVVWLPSLWPETYSYTLSIALKANLPVFAFDIGAIARRLTECGSADTLMPLAWHNQPERIAQRFTTARGECLLPETHTTAITPNLIYEQHV